MYTPVCAVSAILLPRLAVDQGAPQPIIRRSLPSPDRLNNSVHTVCSCGKVPPQSGEHFSSYRLHVCKIYTGIVAWVILISFFSQISEDVQVFLIFRN